MAGTVVLTTGKTGQRMILPLAKPLTDYLATLPAVDHPDAPLFPQASASGGSTGTQSNRFRDILVFRQP